MKGDYNFTVQSSGAKNRPFEWLTSPESLDPILSEVLEHLGDLPPATISRHAMDIGCGSSALGEFLVESKNFHRVYDVDRDAEALQRIKERWSETAHKRGLDASRLECVQADFSKDRITCCPDGSMDLIVDKSTLDCTLCSDRATSHLICEVYRLLKESGGVYLVISFHSIAMLLPLLRDCPGADWEVSYTTMERHVEDLISSKSKPPAKQQNALETTTTTLQDSFQRDGLNVVWCRRFPGNKSLDADSVYEHALAVSDAWFQTQHPMLTSDRENALREAFANEKTLGLQESFLVLFTESEREHLEYEFFLGDWSAFCDNHLDVPRTDMTLETAIRFLREMQ